MRSSLTKAGPAEAAAWKQLEDAILSLKRRNAPRSFTSAHTFSGTSATFDIPYTEASPGRAYFVFPGDVTSLTADARFFVVGVTAGKSLQVEMRSSTAISTTVTLKVLEV